MKRFILPLFLLTKVVFANPTGENVAGGEVSFSRPSENELQVLQNSDRAIVEWQKFSIDAGELTKFIQPGKDSVLLNKVMGPDISAIFGKLEANGQIFLMNPQGVLIGKTGIIDTAAFLVTAQTIDNDAFMRGEDFSGLSDGIISNEGFIKADWVSLVGKMVNNTGRIEANRVEKVGGRIFLTADESSISSGELEAPEGTIQITGREVTLLAGSITNVNGGEVRLGGGLQGQDTSIPNASKTVIEKGAEVHADAGVSGNGGKVIVWSDEWTDFSGTITAKGGKESGDGGFIEISSHGPMNLVGGVSTLAPFGKTGTLLLDPTDVAIGAANMNYTFACPNFTYTGTPVQITAASLIGFLDAPCNVIVDTSRATSQSQSGNITLLAGATLNWTTGSSLTFLANNNVVVQLTGVIAPTGVGAAFTARAGNDITISENITTPGGNVTLQAGPTSGISTATATGSVFLDLMAIDTTIGGNTGASILVEGYNISAEVLGAAFIHTTNTGNITFYARNDIPAPGFFFRGFPDIAQTDTGTIHIYANGNISVTPGSFFALGAFSGVQIDVRADYDLDGVGDLLYQGVVSTSDSWETFGGGSIFVGGHNVTLRGPLASAAANGQISIVTNAGGNIEIQARNDFSAFGGIFAGIGNGRIVLTGSENVLIRAGEDISLMGGSATLGLLFWTAVDDFQIIGGGDVSLIGGTSAVVGSVNIGANSVSIVSGGDLTITAGMGNGVFPTTNNSVVLTSATNSTLLHAQGSIICTNGPSNGMTTGYAGIFDNNTGCDVRAGGDVQFARTLNAVDPFSIYIAADATIIPLWTAQTGDYLTDTVLATTRSILSNDSGGYRTFTSPEPGGITLAVVNQPLTLYSSAHFVNGSVANIVFDTTMVNNATNVFASGVGNIQIGSFHNTDVNNSITTGGAILIATDNTMNINTPSGFVTAGGPITLIVDEQTPVIASGGFFNNFNSGISTTDPQQRIAIYAASGPLPPAGFSFPNQVSLGNLSAVETWDFNLPLGLLSKYGTSFEAGGIVHGGGFGANYVAGVGKFSSPVIWYKVFITSILEEIIANSLAALQELRTLVPERLWVQEFSILVDRQAFREHVKSLMSHRSRETTIQSRYVLAQSKDYLMRSTMSGENIRLMDRYQEFEQSPFWRTPEMMSRLQYLEENLPN